MDVRFVFTPVHRMCEIKPQPRVGVQPIGKLELPKPIQKMETKTPLAPPPTMWAEPEAQTPKGVARLYRQAMVNVSVEPTLKSLARRGIKALHILYMADLPRQAAVAYELRNYLVEHGLKTQGTGLLKTYLQTPYVPADTAQDSQASLF